MVHLKINVDGPACAMHRLTKKERRRRRSIIRKNDFKKGKKKNNPGAAGHWSPYLSHAKRALYHLSYSPWWITETLASSLASCLRVAVEYTQKCKALGGIEPPTPGLQDQCSSHWAKEPLEYSTYFCVQKCTHILLLQLVPSQYRCTHFCSKEGE